MYMCTKICAHAWVCEHACVSVMHTPVCAQNPEEGVKISGLVHGYKGLNFSPLEVLLTTEPTLQKKV